MSILKLIASTSYLTVNKTLAKKLSLEAAILYADLASVQIYWHERGEAWFFRTRDQIEDDTTLSRSKQIKAYKMLEEKGLIKSKFKGIPAKKYYHIDSDCEENLVFLLSDNNTASCLKIKRLEHQKLNGINKNKENKNIDNNKLKEKSIKKENSSKSKSQSSTLINPKTKKEKVPPKRKKGLDFSDITWPPVFEQNSQLKETFLVFAQMRKECKKPYKTLKGIETKIRALAKDCDKFGTETVIGAIEFSTGSEYMGIFVQDFYNKKTKHEKQRTNSQPKKGFYEAYHDAIYKDEPEAQNNTIDIDWDE